MDPEFPRVLSHLEDRLSQGRKVYTADHLSAEADCAPETARQALEHLADRGKVARSDVLVCECDGVKTDADSGTCPPCGDREIAPVLERRYSGGGPVTRDVRWILLLHGMNTAGAWQEALTWRLARMYGYSVPVAIYKYGIVRPGAILKFRQKALRDGLRKRIGALSGEAAGSGFGGKPDVIAHSLGTWLLAEALRNDPTLQVGRVILLGCIVRPDFDWEPLRRNGQVEEVLCHYSAKDFWAWIAHYIIPGSGPAGVRGFNDRTSVAHQAETSLGHSDYFRPENIGERMEKVWRPFFTAGSSAAFPRAAPLTKPWKQARWLWRATLWRFTILAVVSAAVVAALATFAAGVFTLITAGQ